MHEADDVVGGLSHHRIAGVRRLEHLADRPVGRHVTGRKSTSVRGTITSRSARSPAAKTSSTICRSSSEMVVEPLTSARISSSLTSSRPGRRIAAEQPDEDVGRGAQEPDHRPQHRGDEVDQRRQGERDRLRALQGEPLGSQLADDDRHVRDEHGDQDQRDGGGHPCGESGPHQHSGEASESRSAPKAAARKPNSVTPICTADRNTVGIVVESSDRLAALAAVGQLPDLAVAQRDQGHLGGDEHASDAHQHQDQRNVEQDRVHRGQVILGSR